MICSSGLLCRSLKRALVVGDKFLDTEVLLNWKLRCAYPQRTDWVFASPDRKGKQPYWPGSLFRVHLKPALEAAEIPGKVGWHTLRHTFGTLMTANGEDIKTIQELLRHSNYKVTADTYTQAVTPMKRAAQTKLVKMILLPSKQAGEKQASSE
ncbi:MAG TPA: tyrosine-type recombinase/integrase [Terriglobales bacterium]